DIAAEQLRARLSRHGKSSGFNLVTAEQVLEFYEVIKHPANIAGLHLYRQFFLLAEDRHIGEVRSNCNFTGPAFVSKLTANVIPNGVGCMSLKGYCRGIENIRNPFVEFPLFPLNHSVAMRIPFH